jgi:hypothetical protein
MAENIFQDSTADYSSKPLPELPSWKYSLEEITHDSDKFLLIEDISGENDIPKDELLEEISDQ